jgi:tRNA A-37 threonylcarbamoyl transferase component Bud32
MLCPSCRAEIEDDAEACFTCGKAVFALTQGTVLGGRYEIVSPLGRGGMGRVYKAYDRVMDEHVALKVLRREFMRDPEMSRRFVSEIKLARKIGHRNVCRIHEYGEDGDIRFIVMELLSGMTLKEYLHDEPLPPDAAYDVSTQIARGLNAVHELGIVHRDVKTANIMIDEAGVAKLVDFGIARQVSSDLTDPSAAGMIMCTPEYMSPEQVHGGSGSFHSDVYALGCVVYELFTGHAPYRGATPVATLLMHLHDDLPLGGEDAKHIPAPLVPILKRALAKDPDERYASVSDFAEAMAAAAAAEGFAGVHRGGLRRPARASGRDDTGARTSWLRQSAPRTWRWAIAILAVATAALALLAQLRPADPLPAPVAMPSPVSLPTQSAPATAAPDVVPAVLTASPVPPPFDDALAPAASPPARAAAPRPSTPATAAASARPSPATGILRLLVVPESRVSIDGNPLGLVSRRELPLSLGTHTVRVEHPDYQPLQRRVTIRDGDPEVLVLDLAEKGIRRN